ncbi:MAG: helix-turn-helix transcriptional regulator [Clostridiales bacterium]|nr:helix-turn-helix transcriptional regulator [Clostridiales bacterium]
MKFFYFAFSFAFCFNSYSSNMYDKKTINVKGVSMQNKYLLLSERSRSEILSVMPREREILRLADYFQNFSDSTRIKILTCLSMMEMCVNDLSAVLAINQTTISHQLKQLKDQGIVSYKRNGKILVYRLINENVNDMMMYALNVI